MSCNDSCGKCVARVRQFIRTWNMYFEDIFEKIGRFIGRYPWAVCVTNLVILILLCIGLTQYQIESNFFNLFLARDSPVYKENEFINQYWSTRSYNNLIVSGIAKAGDETNILDETYFYEWYQFHLDFFANSPTINYTDSTTNETLTFGYFLQDYNTPEGLTVLLSKETSQVPYYASNILPLCRNFANSPLEAQFELPCYVTQILDCFTEGGYSFPYANYLEKTYLSSLYPSNPYDTKPSFQGMTSVELGQYIAPSCQVFTGTTIPSNYIYGGENRVDNSDETSQVLSLTSLQTIFFVDSSYGIARKIQIATGQCTYAAAYSISCPEPTTDEANNAANLLLDWQLLFINFMADYVAKANADDTKLLTYVYFTPRTESDLLSEATNANIYLIVIAFVAMIVFASVRAFRPHNLFLSRSEDSCLGVLLVSLSVASTMGIGAVFWKFSPNVIQVIPFIGLAFGVDDFFVVLDSFRYRENKSTEEMTGEMLRFAGTACTSSSLAVFLAFLVGTFMDLPDIVRFCRFGILLVIINYFLVLPAFVAIIALTTRRMKRGYRDCAYLFCFPEWMKASESHNETHAHHTVHFFDPLFDWLTQDSTRIGLSLGFFGLLAVGIYGCTLAQIGLPLQDIVPTSSYAYDFLQIRAKFYYAYIMSLYTDAHLNELIKIDWQNNFSLWINETEQVYNVSDLIYTDPAVHFFWAWDLQSYLQTKWAETFADYELATFSGTSIDLTESSRIISSNCENDRTQYCPSLFADFSYATALFKCLDYNYDNLASGCQSYIAELKTENANSTSIAKQVEIITITNTSVSGLYVAPSTDTTNVYFIYVDNVDQYYGALYQRDDNTWYILDENYNLVFYSEATLAGSEPPQSNWYDANGNFAEVSTIFFDASLSSYFRDTSFFIDFDVERTIFNLTYYFQHSNNNSGGCLASEILKLSMKDTFSFSYISLTSSATNYSSKCDAVLGSSILCHGISDNHIENVTCGIYEKTFYKTKWWIGSCVEEDFTIIGTYDDSSNHPLSTDCSCTNNTLNFNYLSTCSYSKDNWGFFDGTKTSCGTEDQQISLVCEPLDTCDNLEACYYDLYNLTQIGNNAGCELTDIETYVKRGKTGPMATCLLRHYSSLSSCCKEAVDIEIIDLYTCANLSSYSDNNGTICALKDTCDTNCQQICYGDVIADCNNLITSNCSKYYNNSDGSGLYNCLTKIASTTSCCYEQLQNYFADTSCIITPDSYYNFGEQYYMYNNCQNAIVNEGLCGRTYVNNVTQLDCLLENIDSVTDYCCHKTLNLIQPSYIFTRDCQGDTKYYCGGVNAASADASCLNSLGYFREKGDLSPNCEATTLYCPVDGDWPLTKINTTKSIPCATSYSGNRTRQCIQENSVATWSNVTDEDNCILLSCPAEVDQKGQSWTSSYVGYVQHYISRDATAYSKVAGCSGSAPYVQRLCDIDTTNNSAYWNEPIYWCRNIYDSWPHNISNKACDPQTESIVAELDVSSEGSFALQIAECESYCLSALTHCVGFRYVNSTSSICYFYDYCNLNVSVAHSNGSLWYYNTETLPETFAVSCGSNPVSAAYSSNGIPDPTCFNIMLYQYLVDPAGGVLYQDYFVVPNSSVFYEIEDVILNLQNFSFITSYNQISVKGLVDESVAVTFILAIRNWLDNTLYPKGFYVIPGGLIISLFSEYVGLQSLVLKTLIYVGIALTLCSFLFLLNLWAVIILMICNIATVVEVYGFLDWVNLRVNGVFALNIMIAVGTTFIFSAHMGRAFVITTVKPEDHQKSIAIPYATDGQIRMKKAMRDMFSAVSLGALTTFIGVVPIVGSTFPYFKQYYFILYVLIIVFGWVNGVIFQPVFLSWFPPTPFLTFSQQKESVSNLRGSNVQLSEALQSENENDVEKQNDENTNNDTN